MTFNATILGKALDTLGARGGQVASLDTLAAGANHALQVAHVKDPKQAAAFIATMLFESDHFRATSEYLAAPGTALRANQNRYYPYIGRSFEMLTWQYNYAAFGSWCYSKKLVSNPNAFVNAPTSLGALTWAWLGGAWFWESHDLWTVAGTGDFTKVTQIVNGGTSGLSARLAIYNLLLKFGSQLLPAAPVTPVASLVLTVGSTGPHVANLQNGLNRVFPGYKGTPLKPDSIYGPATKSVVMEFQRRAGHLSVDGICGPNTIARLSGYGIHV